MCPPQYGETWGGGDAVPPVSPSHLSRGRPVSGLLCRPGQWLARSTDADADRVLLVVVAYAGPLRLAVLGIASPRVVRGRSAKVTTVTRSPSSAVNALCST